jgi:hypothetical protein
MASAEVGMSIDPMSIPRGQNRPERFGEHPRDEIPHHVSGILFRCPMFELHVSGKSTNARDVALPSAALIRTKDVLSTDPVAPVLRQE